jgi:hypothetical protein
MNHVDSREITSRSPQQLASESRPGVKIQDTASLASLLREIRNAGPAWHFRPLTD